MLYQLFTYSAFSTLIFALVFVTYLEVYARVTGVVLNWRDAGFSTLIPVVSYIGVFLSLLLVTGCGLYYIVAAIAKF